MWKFIKYRENILVTSIVVEMGIVCYEVLILCEWKIGILW